MAEETRGEHGREAEGRGAEAGYDPGESGGRRHASSA